MRRILWGSLDRSLDNRRFFFRSDLLGAAATMPVLDHSGQSVAFISPPPQQNRRQRGRQVSRKDIGGTASRLRPVHYSEGGLGNGVLSGFRCLRPPGDLGANLAGLLRRKQQPRPRSQALGLLDALVRVKGQNRFELP